MSPLVSIAIPIYNAGLYIKDAVISVINQTYQHWELILINDGSTDTSQLIIEECAKLDERITIINDGHNMGLVARLNQSVNIAKGKYYARMDADDIMYLTRIEEQVKFLEEHPQVDVLGTSIMLIDNNNQIIGSHLTSGCVSGFIHPTVMGKLQWFRENPYKEWAVRAEDAELWLRTKNHSVFMSLGKPLLFYREFGIPTTRKYIATQKTLLCIYRRYSDYQKSLSWCVKNSLYVCAKIIIYCIADVFNGTRSLIRMRRRYPISCSACLTQRDLLDSISI